MFGLSKKKQREPVALPESLMPEDPVNYNSVLDYLVGLSKADYSKMTRSADIYREANQKVAKVIGVKDEPTTAIRTERPEVTDDELDNMLNEPDLNMAFLEDDIELPKPKKPQAADKKVEVKD